ncbi:MAG: ABC transporter transmembrane domain-containing protein, partial [Stackebrandtia sp.]
MTPTPSENSAKKDPTPEEPEPPRRRHPLTSLWQLRVYLRRYRVRMIAMFVLAMSATGAALVVPWLIQAVIDGPITHGEHSGLWLLGAAIAVFGIAEAVIVWVRRFIQAKVALGLEADMRADLYSHMQKLHAGFHDRWQTGQLLARATADLGSMRRFMAWGLIFGIMS